MNIVNGLHSGTKFYTKELGNLVSIEYHEHPKTKQLVVLKNYVVPNGEDDIDYEFEVVVVHSSKICKIIKKLINLK